ncbi:Flp pilus assembly complex ATPase component TadA [Candidatus Uhrbacteria bacterium]|nr:Flp pilus assembly complex ATPase component TadA [Candidatus Uhrbacteria bacterium]
MLHYEDLIATLTNEGLLKESEIATHTDAATKEGLSLEEYLIRKKIVAERELYEHAAKTFALPFVDCKEKSVKRDVLTLIPEQFAHAHQVIAWDDDGTTIALASTNPHQSQTIEFIEKRAGRAARLFLTTPTSIADALRLYHKNLAAEVALLQTEHDEKIEGTPITDDLSAVRVVDLTLKSAIAEGASDIHIEPTDRMTIIRFRVDGMLKKTMELEKAIHSGIVARIKVLADLKIDEHRLPQDGRFKIIENDQRISFRVSIIPVADGEKIVIRILNESSRPLTLDQLGLQREPLAIVERGIKKPHGMILVTGPTGSGKTTTLYTILNIVNTPEVNILTVEDPIEYRMPGINQSQVNPRIGFTFANALRSFLRQDPNIIMVGEIRDTETGEIAVHAALTGHLVLSTLHTNDAVTTLPRLLDMGIAPFLVASTINVIIAQRLVRKICQKCIEPFATTTTSIESLTNALKGKKGSDLKFFHGKGCKQCNNEGYKGRVGIYEVLEMTPALSALILERAPRDAFVKAAHEQKMLTLLDDGLAKAKQGITTIEEVLRVTKE